MSDKGLALLSTVIGFQFTAIGILAFVLVKTREELIRLRQQIRDLVATLNDSDVT